MTDVTTPDDRAPEVGGESPNDRRVALFIADCRSENAITLADSWVARFDFGQIVERAGAHRRLSASTNQARKVRVVGGMPSCGLR